MKKTMLVAALASTVFSGVAMAWTTNGTGGNIEIGGNIQVTPYSTPWEVEVGAPATTLDANITKGVKAVSIPVTKAIPILGIRVANTSKLFNGAPGIAPLIDFKNAVDIDGFVKGVTTLRLPVVDTDDTSIVLGELTANFYAGAEFSQTWTEAVGSNKHAEKFTQFADGPGQGFYGGLPKNYASSVSNASTLMNSLFPAVLANYSDQGAPWGAENGGYSQTSFVNFSAAAPNSVVFSSFYGSGIQAGTSIKLALNNIAANDVIKWKASLPVTVSYR